MDDDPQLLCTLVQQVLEGHTVDLAALQAAADALLTECHGGDEYLRAATRAMAGAAFALGAYGTDEALEDLRTAARGFTMILWLHQRHH
ncbi:hypothetical protein EAH80_22805 [Mycobacterium hodleri]|uniref:Uncharacterized protein n=2 Tax=Mycolicibacterium hodleri TaxID=49897 RepID=A0A502E2D5_9MYCO|nr:hypothetical protein EAH80_22805 [Mycolicibacterium hodleri]